MKRDKPRCGNCGGTGRVKVYDGQFTEQFHYEDCSICLGTGEDSG